MYLKGRQTHFTSRLIFQSALIPYTKVDLTAVIIGKLICIPHTSHTIHSNKVRRHELINLPGLRSPQTSRHCVNSAGVWVSSRWCHYMMTQESNLLAVSLDCPIEPRTYLTSTNRERFTIFFVGPWGRGWL